MYQFQWQVVAPCAVASAGWPENSTLKFLFANSCITLRMPTGSNLTAATAHTQHPVGAPVARIVCSSKRFHWCWRLHRLGTRFPRRPRSGLGGPASRAPWGSVNAQTPRKLDSTLVADCH